MRHSIYASLPLVVLLCVAMPVAGRAAVEEVGTVTGQVVLVDRDRQTGRTTVKPRPDRQVVVWAISDFSSPSVKTDENGNFHFTLRPGRWTIYAEADGYPVPPSDYTVDVSGERKERYPITPDPPIYMTREIAVVRGKEHRFILAVYREVDSGAAQQEATAPDFARGMILEGKVISPRQKPVADARVSVRVNKTKSEQLFTLAETFTDKQGGFKLDLTEQPGYDRYVLFVTREGFARFVTFFARGKRPPSTITLREAAEVGESAALERTEAARRYVFSTRVMEALPLRGWRTFDSFALLAPGVLPAPDTPNTRGPGVSPGVGTAGQFSVNGLRSRENNFTVDGSDNNDEDIGTRRQGFVGLAPQPVESLQEFQIVTALGSANFGRNLGGQVNALTKSGGPDLHASLYGFFTHDRLSAHGAFDREAQSGAPPFTLRRALDAAPVLLDGRPIVAPDPAGGENSLTRAQVGVTAGGALEPIGTFFFGSFERVRLREARESHFVVPTVEQRALFDSGATGIIFQPRTFEPERPGFPTSLPGDAIYSLYPFPNNPLGPFGPNTYTSVLRADGEGTRLSAKLDRQFGTSTQKRRRPWSILNNGDILIGRYSLSQETSTIPTTGEALFSSLRPRVRTQNVAFYLNRTLAQRLSDVIRFSFGRTKLSFREERDSYLSPSRFFPDTPFLLNAPLLLNVTAPLANETLTPPRYVTAASPQGAALLAARGYTGITHAEQIAGALGQVILPGFSPLGVDVDHFPQSRANNTIQAADTFTYVSRRGHVYTSGVDMRKTQINSTLDRSFRPLAVFGGLDTGFPSVFINGHLPGGGELSRQVFSPTTLAAGGTPTGLFQTLAVVPNSTVGIRFTQISSFLQGNWRLGTKVRLTGGVRYDYNTVPDTEGKVVERAFDSDELRSLVQAEIGRCAEADDPVRCRGEANAVLAAFPTGFKVTFGEDRHDFAGRFGLAWSLGGRTVLRGGFGTYSGQFPGVVMGQSRNAFPNFVSYNFANTPFARFGPGDARSFLSNPANPLLRQLIPGFPLAPGSLNTLAPGINVVSFLISASSARAGELNFINLVLPQQGLTTPYAMQYGLTLERQFGRDYVASVAYVGTRGLKLLRVATPDLGLARSLFDPVVGPFLTSSNSDNFPDFEALLRPPAGLVFRSPVVSRTLFESSAASTYHSLQAELRRRYARRLLFSSALTYSHAIDDASDFFDTAGAFALPQDSVRRSERASSNFDVRLRSVTHAVYDIRRDFFFGNYSKLGGWQVAAVVVAQTGQPYTVNSAFDINRDGNLTDRLDNTVGLIVGSADGGRTQLQLAPGTDPFSLLSASGGSGAVGRNTFRAPGLFNVDLSLTKHLNLSDRRRLNLRVEVFNLLDRKNFGIPVRILESPAFGKSTYTITPPRSVQLAASLSF